jgi:hypothetical protein
MKLFAYIFAVYLLMLTGIPCRDIAGQNLLHASAITSHSTDGQHHDADHCSPFCTCDCCACPAANPDNVIDFTSFPYLQKFVSNYSSSYISSLFVTIWQPPKLS